MSMLKVDPTGPLLAGDDDARDLIGEAFGLGADTIAIPVARLSPEFFRLASGIAGGMLQKFTNYHLRVIIHGDIEPWLARSAPLRDFVRESNRRGEIRFLPTLPDDQTAGPA